MAATKRVRKAASKTKKLTPMFAQYFRVKERVGDAVLFFRMGDFYELFFDDAVRAAPVLDVTLTSRNKDDPEPIPMCGVPYRAARAYVGKLVSHGFRVAICDQVGDPATSTGLVERELVRIITPGTVLEEEEGLSETEPAYLTLVQQGDDGAVALVTVEVSTGEVRCCAAADLRQAREEVTRIRPRELLFDEASTELQGMADEIGIPTTPWRRPDDLGDEVLATIERVGPAGEALSPLLTAALQSAVAYVGETLRSNLSHLRPAASYSLGESLTLDDRSRRNLAVVEGADGGRHGSLWWVMDQTATPMGSRRLREWLVYPSLDLERIEARLDAVEELYDAPGLRADLAEALKSVGDLERLVARIGVGRAGPRELLRLGRALERVAEIRALLGDDLRSGELLAVAEGVVAPEGLAERLVSRIADDPPISVGEGGAMRDGADAELDEVRGLLRDAQGHIAALEARERDATGIGSLKVRYHRVLGYFLEVTKANLSLVPERFVRRQSMASGERYTTDELVELEQKLSTADVRAREREAVLFGELLGEVSAVSGRLQSVAEWLAALDALCGFASAAHGFGYVRPKLHTGNALKIREGRHPIVERTSAEGSFVSNDTQMDDRKDQVVILTGPNMAGKSTYLRQVALITLMAHAGSFVPAAEAEVPLTDRIWTRVGAADDLVAGDSTFMVEMKETASILGGLTPRTLVVLDEIGRGTSTYDGIAIAWAVAEYLHDFQPGPGSRVKTLFATHFHELTALAESRSRVTNQSVAVREWKDQVMFLRRVVPGPASRSYGVAVARLAGVPEDVVHRARDLLRDLEEGNGPADREAVRAAEKTDQLELFGSSEAEVLQELASVEAETMTPIQALQLLDELSRRARGE